jgi:hypothetical protein
MQNTISRHSARTVTQIYEDGVRKRLLEQSRQRMNEQLTQHKRMLKVRDFITTLAVFSLATFCFFVLCIIT